MYCRVGAGCNSATSSRGKIGPADVHGKEKSCFHLECSHSSYSTSPKRRRILSPPPSGAFKSQTGNECAVHYVDLEHASERKISDKQNTPCEANRYPAIEFWARNSSWPESFLKMASSESPRRRSASYTQSAREGHVPAAHTAAGEIEMAKYGVIMSVEKDLRLLTDNSIALCDKMRDQKYNDPAYTLFPLSRLSTMWQRAHNRNEARVVRDISPLLVPSAELLFLIGGHDGFDHIIEELGTDWSKPNTMGSLKPRPNLSVGVATSAFTIDELHKLWTYTSPEHPTLFTDFMYFPFLICEMKCGDQPINRAERQSAHAASIAVNAIIQLHGVQNASHLLGEILVFSVAHDNERVKIYGHYAIVEDGVLKFYRYEILNVIFTLDIGDGRQKAYSFICEIYESFYPEHLKRIKNALAGMTLSPPEEPPQTPTTAVSSGSGFTIPGRASNQQLNHEVQTLREVLQAEKRQHEESNQILRDQIGMQVEQTRRYQEKLKKQSKQNQEQLERQEKQNEEQTKRYQEQLERQAKQNEEQTKRYQDQLERQAKQSEEQIKRYQEQTTRQETHHQEQIKMLKEQTEVFKQLLKNPSSRLD